MYISMSLESEAVDELQTTELEDDSQKFTFKLLDRLGNPLTPQQVQVFNIQEGHDLYLTPHFFESVMQQKECIRFNPYKGDIFALGIMVLKCGLMVDVGDLYNVETGQFNYELLEEMKAEFVNIFDDAILTELLNLLLEVDDTKRMSPKGVQKKMDIILGRLSEKPEELKTLEETEKDDKMDEVKVYTESESEESEEESESEAESESQPESKQEEALVKEEEERETSEKGQSEEEQRVVQSEVDSLDLGLERKEEEGESREETGEEKEESGKESGGEEVENEDKQSIEDVFENVDEDNQNIIETENEEEKDETESQKIEEKDDDSEEELLKEEESQEIETLGEDLEMGKREEKVETVENEDKSEEEENVVNVESEERLPEKEEFENAEISEIVENEENVENEKNLSETENIEKVESEEEEIKDDIKDNKEFIEVDNEDEKENEEEDLENVELEEDSENVKIIENEEPQKEEEIEADNVEEEKEKNVEEMKKTENEEKLSEIENINKSIKSEEIKEETKPEKEDDFASVEFKECEKEEKLEEPEMFHQNEEEESFEEEGMAMQFNQKRGLEVQNKPPQEEEQEDNLVEEDFGDFGFAKEREEENVKGEFPREEVFHEEVIIQNSKPESLLEEPSEDDEHQERWKEAEPAGDHFKEEHFEEEVEIQRDPESQLEEPSEENVELPKEGGKGEESGEEKVEEIVNVVPDEPEEQLEEPSEEEKEAFGDHLSEGEMVVEEVVHIAKDESESELEEPSEEEIENKFDNEEKVETEEEELERDLMGDENQKHNVVRLNTFGQVQILKDKEIPEEMLAREENEEEEMFEEEEMMGFATGFDPRVEAKVENVMEPVEQVQEAEEIGIRDDESDKVVELEIDNGRAKEEGEKESEGEEEVQEVELGSEEDEERREEEGEMSEKEEEVVEVEVDEKEDEVVEVEVDEGGEMEVEEVQEYEEDEVVNVNDEDDEMEVVELQENEEMEEDLGEEEEKEGDIEELLENEEVKEIELDSEEKNLENAPEMELDIKHKKSESKENFELEEMPINENDQIEEEMEKQDSEVMVKFKRSLKAMILNEEQIEKEQEVEEIPLSSAVRGENEELEVVELKDSNEPDIEYHEEAEEEHFEMRMPSKPNLLMASPDLEMGPPEQIVELQRGLSQKDEKFQNEIPSNDKEYLENVHVYYQNEYDKTHPTTEPQEDIPHYTQSPTLTSTLSKLAKSEPVQTQYTPEVINNESHVPYSESNEIQRIKERYFPKPIANEVVQESPVAQKEDDIAFQKRPSVEVEVVVSNFPQSVPVQVEEVTANFPQNVPVEVEKMISNYQQTTPIQVYPDYTVQSKVSPVTAPVQSRYEPQINEPVYYSKREEVTQQITREPEPVPVVTMESTEVNIGFNKKTLPESTIISKKAEFRPEPVVATYAQERSYLTPKRSSQPFEQRNVGQESVLLGQELPLSSILKNPSRLKQSVQIFMNLESNNKRIILNNSSQFNRNSHLRTTEKAKSSFIRSNDHKSVPIKKKPMYSQTRNPILKQNIVGRQHSVSANTHFLESHADKRISVQYRGMANNSSSKVAYQQSKFIESTSTPNNRIYVSSNPAIGSQEKIEESPYMHRTPQNVETQINQTGLTIERKTLTPTMSLRTNPGQYSTVQSRPMTESKVIVTRKLSQSKPSSARVVKYSSITPTLTSRPPANSIPWTDTTDRISSLQTTNAPLVNSFYPTNMQNQRGSHNQSNTAVFKQNEYNFGQVTENIQRSTLPKESIVLSRQRNPQLQNRYSEIKSGSQEINPVKSNFRFNF